MTVHASPKSFGLDALLAAHQAKDVLRFLTCGSVDDGKSTLIGRLLHDTEQLFDDQVVALAKDSRKHGTQGEKLDLALLVDGLAAEREQGITIDVAYRFFSTEKRTFIVADTPGHEQYTRNMATGASMADLAVILVDARKGLTRQTRRHSLIVSMLGIRHVVLAVNKMDAVGWSQDAYEAIMADYAALATDLGFSGVTGIPLSALNGDNVVYPAAAAPWYDGPTLLAHLERVEIGTETEAQPFRMPVQWVNRPNADFRGFSGFVTSGTIRPGDRIRVLPSGQESAIARIVTSGRDLDEVVAGQSVTLTLADEIDISRGDVLCAADAPAQVGERLAARLFWMGGEAVRPGASYLLKIGARTVGAAIAEVKSRVDLETLTLQPVPSLEDNDVGDVVIALDRPIGFDPYAESRETGGFILIDREGCDTVGIGLVSAGVEPQPKDAGAGEEEAVAPAASSRWLTPALEKPWRSFIKTVSWRAIGSIGSMALAYLLTSDIRIVAAIGLTELTAKGILYYGHERLWSRLRLGVREARGPAAHTDASNARR
jgi:sulfate adenylyltransferase large subunit